MGASRSSPADPSRQGNRSPLIARRDLFERLSSGAPAGVTLVSAPAGSGKTVLLRSWIDDGGLAARVAWITVDRGERDPQRFWLAIVERLREAVGADAFIEKLTASPDFDGEALVARLVSELRSLEDPVLLVIDDLHELQSAPALSQLAFLVDRRPPMLRIVLATRRDPQLGLHRLRLTGELTVVRTSDLRFTLGETRELLVESGIALPEEAVERLYARCEGWAAGLRLAALSLAAHPDPEQFVAEFSGSERTVADYLLAEVLEREREDVRRLLLRTSILERVNGALADVLVEASGSERILLDLEQANAFVVSVDAQRTWFRYHALFADLLRLELRRTEPGAVAGLHRAAAAWMDEHGQTADAIRHLLAAEDWSNAARLLAEHSFSLYLDGHDATVHALLAAFPEHALSDPELARVVASDQLVQGSLNAAETFLALARKRASEVPAERRHRFNMALGVTHISLARRRGDFGSVLEEVEPLLTPLTAESVTEIALGADIRAIALMDLGIVELWSFRHDDAERHLEQGLDLARRIGRPYVQIGCLSYLALAAAQRSFTGERDRSLEAVAIAEAHGWEAEPIICVALATLGAAAVYECRFEEAQHWLDRAERALRPDLEPAEALLIHLARGMQRIGLGHLEESLAAFRAAEDYQARLAKPHVPIVLTRQLLAHTQLRLGDEAAARATLTQFSATDRELGEARTAIADVHLAEGDPGAAAAVLAPVVGGKVQVVLEQSVLYALLFDAIAQDRLGQPLLRERSIERALDLAERTGHLFPFVVAPVRELLQRHPRHRTTHAALLANILDVLAGATPAARPSERPSLKEELSESELRVLRYLPSNLSAPEIASQLYLSTSTVKTHLLHVYAKLGVHRRTEAVERARELGLLTPISSERR